MDDKILDVLYKKALGYKTKEVQEEFVNDEGKLELIKRKISTKHVPPDINAAKIYLEFKDSNSLEGLSDEELEAERVRILNLIKKEEEENEDRKK